MATDYKSKIATGEAINEIAKQIKKKLMGDSNLILSKWLPGYVDDVVEFNTTVEFDSVQDLDWETQEGFQTAPMADLATDEVITGLYYDTKKGVFYMETATEDLDAQVTTIRYYFTWSEIEGYPYPDSETFSSTKKSISVGGTTINATTMTPNVIYKAQVKSYILGDSDNVEELTTGKLYVQPETQKIYRWSGSTLVLVGNGEEVDLSEVTEAINNLEEENNTQDTEISLIKDTVFAEQKSVPAPSIKISWTFQNNAGSTVEGVNESSDATKPTLERGYKATYSASYSWTNPDSNKYKNPTAASGNWTTLTSDGVESDMISDTITATSSSKSISITLSAPKTGLMVSGSKVIPATGNDTASASKSVTFLPRIYYGWSDEAPAGDTAADTIKDLLNKLQNEATFNSPASKPSGTQYYVFAYPKEWGTINKILMDNADPVTTTFSNNNEVKITNAAGAEYDYYVSVTAAPQKEESFNTNVSFSFYFN